MNLQQYFVRIAVYIILFTFAVSIVNYFWSVRNNQPISQLQSQSILTTPEKIDTTLPRSDIKQIADSPATVLRTYYGWYLACENFHFANANIGMTNKSPQEDCPYNKTDLLTSELAATLEQTKTSDPVLCAQNTPREVIVDGVVTSNTHASGTAHTEWEESPEQGIHVGLDVQNGTWKISSITCSHL